MKVYLKKSFKQFNKGNDIIVTFEEGKELIKKGVAQVEPLQEEEKQIIKKSKIKK